MATWKANEPRFLSGGPSSRASPTVNALTSKLDQSVRAGHVVFASGETYGFVDSVRRRFRYSCDWVRAEESLRISGRRQGGAYQDGRKHCGKRRRRRVGLWRISCKAAACACDKERGDGCNDSPFVWLFSRVDDRNSVDTVHHGWREGMVDICVRGVSVYDDIDVVCALSGYRCVEGEVAAVGVFVARHSPSEEEYGN